MTERYVISDIDPKNNPISKLEIGDLFEINQDTLTTKPQVATDIISPSVECYETPNEKLELNISDKRWSPIAGYSNQQSYSGSIMHESEYISPGMLAVLPDGIYTTETVYMLTDTEDDIIGWVLLRYNDKKNQ